MRVKLPPLLVMAVVYKLFENSMVPVVAVRTKLARLSELDPTAPLKVVPPELVIVRIPISVPMVLETVTAPVVLIVRFEALPLAVPAIDDKLIVFAIPVPIVRVTPSASVVAPKVMVPVEAPPIDVLELTVTGAPRLITPLPAALTVPPKLIRLGAVAVIPPVNAVVSPPLPKVTVPVLAKVVAPAMLLLEPLIATLYAAEPAPTVIPVDRVRLPPIVTVLPDVALVITREFASIIQLDKAPVLVIVTVPISVWKLSRIVTEPVVLIVILEAEPPAVPLIEARIIGLAMPVPSVSVTPSSNVVAARVIVPVDPPPNKVFSRTLTGVTPNLIRPVPSVTEIVPERNLVLGDSAVKPLVKVNVPPLAPKVKVPVLLKVTALVIVPVVALSARL